MNIIDGFRRLFSGKSGETTEGKGTPVGYSFNGDELYKDDIVADIKQKLEKRRSERRTFEAQWLLNANFLYGHPILRYKCPHGRNRDYRAAF